jgi:hypothetical protein
MRIFLTRQQGVGPIDLLTLFGFVWQKPASVEVGGAWGKRFSAGAANKT